MTPYESGERVGRLLAPLLCCGFIVAILVVALVLLRRNRRGTGAAMVGQGMPPAVTSQSPQAWGNGAAIDTAPGPFRDLGAPAYPGLVGIGTQTMSNAGGGGGDQYYFVSTDPIEQVAAFYRAHLGPGADGGRQWSWPGSTPNSGRSLQLGTPVPVPYAQPLPPGTQTMLTLTYHSWG